MSTQPHIFCTYVCCSFVLRHPSQVSPKAVQVMQSLLTHFANTLVSSKTLLLSMIIYISLSFFLPPIHTRISLASPASTPAKQPSPQKMAIAEIISGYRSLSPHFILTVGNSPHTHTIRYYYYFSSINVKIEIQSYHIQGPKAMSGLKRR